MQIGEDDLVPPDQIIFRGLRLFDVHDHLGPLKNLLGGRHNLPAVADVGRIFEAAANPGILFNQDGVTMMLHDLDPGRRHADPIFCGFDFLQNSNNHRRPPCLGSIRVVP